MLVHKQLTFYGSLMKRFFNREKMEKSRKKIENNRLLEIRLMNEASIEAAYQWRSSPTNNDAARERKKQLIRNHRYFGLVPCKAGNIEFVMFSAHDDVVAWEYLWEGDDGYEPDTVQLWIDWCKEEGDVLDIGGYSGLMSILAARANKNNKVYLFEPLERQIERASINVKLNGVAARVELHSMAVSDTNGETEINLYRESDFLSTGSSLDAKEGFEIISTKTIPRVCLDSYLPNCKPVAIKVDVEGHELAALKGMKNIITDNRPNMIIEVWEQNRSAVFDLMSSLSYKLDRVEARDRRVNNYIATPEY